MECQHVMFLKIPSLSLRLPWNIRLFDLTPHQFHWLILHLKIAFNSSSLYAWLADMLQSNEQTKQTNKKPIGKNGFSGRISPWLGDEYIESKWKKLLLQTTHSNSIPFWMWSIGESGATHASPTRTRIATMKTMMEEKKWISNVHVFPICGFPHNNGCERYTATQTRMRRITLKPCMNGIRRVCLLAWERGRHCQEEKRGKIIVCVQ